MNPFLAEAPPDLVAALERREATIELSWRENERAFARCATPTGGVFARYSYEPSDRARIKRETAIRALVGTDGALRAPPVLEDGPDWRIETAVGAEPWAGGAAAVDAAAAAAAEIPALELPPPVDPAPGRSLLFIDVGRIARAVAGPVSLRDLREARRELAQTDLPTVACHRDFHQGNIMIDGADAWVIDWEGAAPGPLGLDLMRLWTGLAAPEDRDRVFEHAVEQVGADRRASLERLRFAVSVAEANGLYAEKNPFDRDDAMLERLLELIPSLRPRT